jgi:hypothetical protein
MIYTNNLSVFNHGWEGYDNGADGHVNSTTRVFDEHYLSGLIASLLTAIRYQEIDSNLSAKAKCGTFYYSFTQTYSMFQAALANKDLLSLGIGLLLWQGAVTGAPVGVPMEAEPGQDKKGADKMHKAEQDTKRDVSEI